MKKKCNLCDKESIAILISDYEKFYVCKFHDKEIMWKKYRTYFQTQHKCSECGSTGWEFIVFKKYFKHLYGELTIDDVYTQSSEWKLCITCFMKGI